MRARFVWASLEIAVAVGIGLGINLASNQLPAVLSAPQILWPSLFFIAAVSVFFTLPRGSVSSTTLSPAWNIAARNPNFTGRITQLVDLYDSLRSRRGAPVHAIRGMAGVGKSQLALEYAYRFRKKYKVAWWISATDPTLIPGQLARLATTAGIEADSDIEITITKLLTRLRTTRRWLIIFDNAESPETIRPFIPDSRGHVIITTRRAGFEAISAVHQIHVMDSDEAVDFLQKRVPALGDRAGQILAEAVGKLPIALEQLASYLSRTNLSDEVLLTDVEKTIKPALTNGVDAHRSHPENSVIKLLKMSFDDLENRHPEAAQLLELCTFLAPEPIPLTLFSSHPSLLPEALSKAATSPVHFAGVVATLADYSLVYSLNSDFLIVHHLLREITRTHYDDRRPSAGNNHPAQLIAQLLRAHLPHDILRSPDSWRPWRQLLPHTLSLFRDDSSSHVNPNLLAYLLDRSGTYLQEIGQLRKSKELFEQALAKLENSSSAGSFFITAADACNDLGIVTRVLGEPEKAHLLFQRALDEGRERGSTLMNMAVSLLDLGRMDEAKELLEEALQIDELNSGPDDPYIIRTLANLAKCLLAMNDPHAAMAKYERALSIAESKLGPTHPSVSVLLRGVAKSQLRIGARSSARKALQRALSIAITHYGRHHRNVTEVQQDLHDLRRQKSRWLHMVPGV